MSRLVNITFMVILAGLLTGCAGYKSNFACPSSKGANCLPMDMVDNMISNGQIEEYNETHRRRNCNKAICCHNLGSRK